MKTEETEIITFKVGRNLSDKLKSIKNRSEFIRSALLAALEQSCPLCAGSGTLSNKTFRHWNDVVENHKSEDCTKC